MLSALAACHKAPASPPNRFGVHVVWLSGAGDENRDTFDAFLACVVEGSNLNRYWDNAVHIALRGSSVVPQPTERLAWNRLGPWLAETRANGHLPQPERGETPVYLVVGRATELDVGACGRNATTSISGETIGLAVVRNTPHCWPTPDRHRTETQIALHELVETIDRLRGDNGCAGGGACRGRAVCPNPCDTFVGLSCPGAPVDTPTGCDGGRVDGWVVQKFSRAARAGGECESCAVCDFTPRACLPGEVDCGMARRP